jgi:4'-phosphopantetheinyl transferase
MSHSFDYAAVMIGKSPVGIDIELVKGKVERIADKFMRPEEMAFITTDEHRIQQLYVCWCAKEAVYKCHGQKEVSFADNIILAPFQFAPKGELQVALDKEPVKNNYTVGYMQYEDYMIGYVKG